MSEPKRQHPVAAISTVLKTLRELLIPIIIVFFFGGGGSGGGIFGDFRFISVFLGILFVYSLVHWLRYTYRIEDNELRIEFGIFVRNKTFIPRHRIQVMNISAGILQRMFGLVSLNVQTAGGSTPGATIQALTREEAEAIKAELAPEEETEVAEEFAGDDSEIARGERPPALQTATEPEPDYYLTWKNLLIAGTTSGSFGIALSIVGTIMSQLDVLVDDEVLLDQAEGLFTSGVSFIIALVIGMIIFAWLLSIFGTILAYANFAIYRKKKEILIKRGLFEKRQVSIPYSRIQAVRIQEGLLRQPFGLATLYVDSAGYGEQSGQSTVLFPLIRRSEAEEFIRNMVPEYLHEANLVTPPPAALRRYLIRTTLPFIMVAVALYFILPFWHFALLLLPFGMVMGYLRYQAAATGVDDNTIVIRYRNLAKTTAIVKRFRVQAAIGWDNWFQRRLGLKSLSIHIASSDTGAVFSARDFKEDFIADLVEWAEPRYLKMGKSVRLPDETDQEKESAASFIDPGV